MVENKSEKQEGRKGAEKGNLVVQLVFDAIQTEDVVTGYEKMSIDLSSGICLTLCFLRLSVSE